MIYHLSSPTKILKSSCFRNFFASSCFIMFKANVVKCVVKSYALCGTLTSHNIPIYYTHSIRPCQIELCKRRGQRPLRSHARKSPFFSCSAYTRLILAIAMTARLFLYPGCPSQKRSYSSMSRSISVKYSCVKSSPLIRLILN